MVNYLARLLNYIFKLFIDQRLGIIAIVEYL